MGQCYGLLSSKSDKKLKNNINATLTHERKKGKRQTDESKSILKKNNLKIKTDPENSPTTDQKENVQKETDHVVIPKSNENQTNEITQQNSDQVKATTNLTELSNVTPDFSHNQLKQSPSSKQKFIEENNLKIIVPQKANSKLNKSKEKEQNLESEKLEKINLHLNTSKQEGKVPSNQNIQASQKDLNALTTSQQQTRHAGKKMTKNEILEKIQQNVDDSDNILKKSQQKKVVVDDDDDKFQLKRAKTIGMGEKRSLLKKKKTHNLDKNDSDTQTVKSVLKNKLGEHLPATPKHLQKKVKFKFEASSKNRKKSQFHRK